MLEVKYKKNTGVIMAWAGSPEHIGGHYKPKASEAVVVLDIPNPEKPSSAYLVDEATQSLIDNPDYTEPKPPRDPLAEIDELKTRVEKLEKGK